MIARLEVTRGTLTEFPLAEKVRGGWQNGVTFYPDAEVTKVTPLHVVTSNPQGEPSDAQAKAERAYASALYPHISWERLTNLTRHEIEVGVAAALRAAGGVS